MRIVVVQRSAQAHEVLRATHVQVLGLRKRRVSLVWSCYLPL